MLTIPTLSDDLIDGFHRDGFTFMPGAFGTAEMKQIENWASDVQILPEESGKQWVYHETSLDGLDNDLINRIEMIAPFHAGFESLIEVLKAPVAQLLGEDSVLFKEKINFKMAGGDGFKPHQDAQAGWERYASYFINVMVCIDEATIENGCLQLAPGHHQSGLAKEWEPLTEDDMASMNFVSLPTRPGDICFFDSYAPHQSDPNTSDKIRRLYFATYNRASEGDHHDAYYADKFANYPPDIDREKDKEYVYRV